MTSSQEEDAYGQYKKLESNIEFLDSEMDERRESKHNIEQQLQCLEMQLADINSSFTQLYEEAQETIRQLNQLKGEVRCLEC